MSESVNFSGLSQAEQIYEQALETGYFGEYGGRFVPEGLLRPLQELENAFAFYRRDRSFADELAGLYRHYCGRPTPIFYCRKLSFDLGGAQIYLKREDLNHLGAHKLNNTLGQALLASRMGKRRLVAETGAGSHGVAAAAAAALFGMECIVFMGEEDMRRQAPNVERMRLMGAEVRGVAAGQGTLKDAADAALGYYAKDPSVFYVLGSSVGPHPYPAMVRHFQSIIGREARAQCMETMGRLPDEVIACVGGGSNCTGMFAGFLGDEGIRLTGVEAGGRGPCVGDNAASLNAGRPAVLHGSRNYVLVDGNGGCAPAYSISAGLDYPGVGPELCQLKDIGRAGFVTASDREAVEAFLMLSRKEGIIPALESSHALAHAIRVAPSMPDDGILLVCLSGRGDKDMDLVLEYTRKEQGKIPV